MADSGQPADTSVLQSLKAETLTALFDIDMPASVTPDMTVLSHDRLMLELTVAGGQSTKYVVTLTSFNKAREAWREAHSTIFEFADKGDDADGNEIIDIQFNRSEVRNNENNRSQDISRRFELKIEKLNADGNVDDSWDGASEKTFEVTILPAPSGQSSGQGGGRAMTEAVPYDDFSPDAGMEDLGVAQPDVF